MKVDASLQAIFFDAGFDTGFDRCNSDGITRNREIQRKKSAEERTCLAGEASIFGLVRGREAGCVFQGEGGCLIPVPTKIEARLGRACSCGRRQRRPGPNGGRGNLGEECSFFALKAAVVPDRTREVFTFVSDRGGYSVRC